jgi:hypothetical protein
LGAELEPDPEEPQAAADTTATADTQAAATRKAIRRLECPPAPRVPGGGWAGGPVGPGSSDPPRAPLPPHWSPIFASIFTLLGFVKERSNMEKRISSEGKKISNAGEKMISDAEKKDL